MEKPNKILTGNKLSPIGLGQEPNTIVLHVENVLNTPSATMMLSATDDPKNSQIEFKTNGESHLRITANGPVFVKGKEVGNDMMIFEGLKDFIEHCNSLGIIPTEEEIDGAADDELEVTQDTDYDTLHGLFVAGADWYKNRIRR